jgi:hypothetical protein
MSEIFDSLMADPCGILDLDYDAMMRMPQAEIDTLQRHWVCKRFAELRPELPMLDRLATEQGITEVREIDDIAPVLFAHTVYKSYPLSYLERNRFDKLTKWLSGLTTTDLSGIDAKGIESIDDWLDEVDAKSDLTIFHTSGTSGKLSFIPRTKQQARLMSMQTGIRLRDWFGHNSRDDMMKRHRPIINPGYQFGAATAQRMGRWQAELFAGGFDNVLYLYPGVRFSADMQSLAGRIRNAEAKGELGSLQIPQALLERREQLLELERQRPQAVARFLEKAVERFGGENVYIGGIYSLLYDWAVDGGQHGQSRVFGPDTIVTTGGGTKGRTFPDNWKNIIWDYLGVDRFYDTYAMTECTSMAGYCEHEKYHFNPLTVVYPIDPVTGEVLPRRDGTTARMALFDLIPDSYWAGFVTGDEVTLGGWQTPCPCGRTGVYAEPAIRRFSEKEGGDDKVLCSGAPEAHDKAAEFLANYGN